MVKKLLILLFSFIIPGLGQFTQKKMKKGSIIFFIVGVGFSGSFLIVRQNLFVPGQWVLISLSFVAISIWFYAIIDYLYDWLSKTRS